MVPGSESWITGRTSLVSQERDGHAILNGPWEKLSSEQGSSLLVMELECGCAEIHTARLLFFLKFVSRTLFS